MIFYFDYLRKFKDFEIFKNMNKSKILTFLAYFVEIN